MFTGGIRLKRIFLCQEVDRESSDEISHGLANMPKKISKEFIESWRKKVLLLVRQPSTPASIRSMAQKHFAFYAKHLDVNAHISVNDIKLGSHAFVEQLHEMEKQAFLKNITFAGTPVIYREGNQQKR